MPQTRKKRILFIAEAMTLAHVARPLALAESLDPNMYDIYFSCDKAYHHLLSNLDATVFNNTSINTKEFLQSLKRGGRIYKKSLLLKKIEEDTQLIRKINPDLVIGDMRLSLSISARINHVPYAGIVNAHWSPYGNRNLVLPDLTVATYLGYDISNMIFQAIKPLIIKYHAAPINALRKRMLRENTRLDLFGMYTDADYVLYADSPGIVQTTNLPSNHYYLGPIQWSYPTPLPDWWETIPGDRPVIYLNLGSSGNHRIFPTVLHALEDIPATIIAATTDHSYPYTPPKNAFLTDYLPADAALEKADLAIFHGGTGPAYMALAKGIPILGLPGNVDQYLFMSHIERIGAGVTIRSGQATEYKIRKAVKAMLEDQKYVEASQAAATLINQYDASKNFRAFLHSELRSSAGAHSDFAPHASFNKPSGKNTINALR